MDQEKLKIAICDDSRQMCEYFQFIVNREPDLAFVGEAHGTEECLALVQQVNPQMLLLDIQMEKPDSGVQLIAPLKAMAPDMKIVMLTVHQEDSCIFLAMAQGAEDYILKTASAEEILSEVRNVWHECLSLRPEIAQAVLNQGRVIQKNQQSLLMLIHILSKLSKSEVDVLRAIYDGNSYREIAQKRFVEEGTVRVLVSRILSKTEFSNMKEMIEYLRKNRLMDMFDQVRGPQ